MDLHDLNWIPEKGKYNNLKYNFANRNETCVRRGLFGTNQELETMSQQEDNGDPRRQSLPTAQARAPSNGVGFHVARRRACGLPPRRLLRCRRSTCRRRFTMRTARRVLVGFRWRPSAVTETGLI